MLVLECTSCSTTSETESLILIGLPVAL